MRASLKWVPFPSQRPKFHFVPITFNCRDQFVPGREKQKERGLSPILSLLVLLGLEVLVGAKGSQTADEDDGVGDRAEAGRVRVGRGGQRGLGGRGARVAGLQGESVSQVS